MILKNKYSIAVIEFLPPLAVPNSGFIFVRTIFVQNGNCSPFLKLTPTLRQMPRDVTNISED